MKRLLTFLLLFCTILSLGIHAAVATENERSVLLSSLNNEQCRAFLLEQGLTVPEELSNIDLPELFTYLEEDPDTAFSIGWTALANFVESVRSVVKSYYGYTAAPAIRAAAYTLQYSTVDSWNESTMDAYNCYAYAIGRSTACQPGQFSNQTYDDAASIASVASMVKDDLNGDLGYDCVKIQSNRPTSTSGWLNVIAVRKDTTHDLLGINDYHFAKLSSSSWYHKPGRTAILKFNSAPSNSVDWTNEAYDGTYHAPTITYDSDLRYLLYKSNHGNTTYTWTGEHYHSGTRHYYLYAYICNDCGDYVSTVWTSQQCSGPPCTTPWSYTPEPEIS